MKGLNLYLSFDLLLPWSFGPGQGWGFDWFDIGPFTVWWPTPPLASAVAENKWGDAVEKIALLDWGDDVESLKKGNE